MSNRTCHTHYGCDSSSHHGARALHRLCHSTHSNAQIRRLSWGDSMSHLRQYHRPRRNAWHTSIRSVSNFSFCAILLFLTESHVLIFSCIHRRLNEDSVLKSNHLLNQHCLFYLIIVGMRWMPHRWRRDITSCQTMPSGWTLSNAW